LFKKEGLLFAKNNRFVAHVLTGYEPEYFAEKTANDQRTKS
jgi:hypothetical protein